MMQRAPELQLASPIDGDRLDGQPLIIAGPCSAESEEQVMQTAIAVSQIPKVTVFRAGIWKPRTRPNGFEGVGSPGLQWLKRVKEETGLKTAVEVGNANHVYEALKFGVDILWIGARTTVNPFSVQEIADALRGAEVPVWVKNPLNPDLKLWIGALERLNSVGITRLGAIHRGFSTYEKTSYRNAPKWDIAIELMRLIPEIPVICDPSHIGGKRKYIHDISQKALDLAMNGLMIETHIDPDSAMSDKEQQLLPATLKELIDSLNVRKERGDGSVDEDMLAILRAEIDSIDYELMDVIGRRTAMVDKIGRYKKEHNMTILQVNRWEQLLADRLQRAQGAGLDKAFVEYVFQLLHQHSIQMQSKLMNEEE